MINILAATFLIYPYAVSITPLKIAPKHPFPLFICYFLLIIRISF